MAEFNPWEPGDTFAAQDDGATLEIIATLTIDDVALVVAAEPPVIPDVQEVYLYRVDELPTRVPSDLNALTKLELISLVMEVTRRG